MMIVNLPLDHWLETPLETLEALLVDYINDTQMEELYED